MARQISVNETAMPIHYVFYTLEVLVVVMPIGQCVQCLYIMYVPRSPSQWSSRQISYCCTSISFTSTSKLSGWRPENFHFY